MLDMRAGNCYGHHELTPLFFSTNPADIARAKQICTDCPVIFRCKSIAEDFGVWGGESERDRRKNRRLSLSTLLEELHVDSSLPNTQHVQVHLAYESSSFLSHNVVQPMQSPSVYDPILAFQSASYTFHIAS